VGLSDAAFGLGSGIFFIGYFLFEIPSNLILEKVGARRWIARIMVSWGLLSACMALVQGPTSFYVVRFLLGVAEAGFFPGMILYLTYWFPWSQRSRIVAAFMVAIPLSSALGAPVSTAVLGTSIAGLHGWQAMFLLEAVPALLLGVLVFFRMTDRPADAKWLTPDEKGALQRALDRDDPAHADGHLHGLGAAMANPQVWRFALVYFGVVMGNYGLGFWMPQIVKGLGDLSNMQTGWLTAAPYLAAAIAMALWGRHADKTQERIWHFALPAALASAAFLTAALSAEPAIRFAGLAVATIGVSCAAPGLWALPTRFLRASGAFGGGLIALAVSVGAAALLALEWRTRRKPAPASP
jgi:ACS family tartrate transporter-like MFS transporter